MTKEEIKDRIKELEKDINILDKRQHAIKILLNSGYGALGNNYFIFYDIRLAKAITYTAQLATRWIIKYIEDNIKNIRIVYGDTDSCLYNTIVNSKKFKNIEIEKLYNLLKGVEEVKSNKKFIKHIIDDDEILSYSNKIEYKKINYMMKHKVKKRFFKIKFNNKEVIITEDHSIIIERNNKIISITIKEIENNDKIITIREIYETIKTSNFEIEDLGIQEHWVYDIEVEDNHNFFGNNILLHNSTYITVSDALKKLCELKKIEYTTLSFDDKFNLINTYIIPKIDKTISEGYDELSKILNAYENTFSMKRELIGNKAILLAKKNYCIELIDKEGSRKTEDDKPYVKGFEIAKKASNSKWIIDNLTKYLKLVFKDNKLLLSEFEKEKFKEFKTLPFNEICFVKNVSSLNNYEKIDSKGAMAHIKGSLVYNQIVKDNNLEGSFPLIHQEDKIHFSYIISPNKFNSNTIAYLDGIDSEQYLKFVKEKYDIEIDYKKQWDTVFLKPARRLTNAIGWKMIDTTKANIFSLLKKSN
jgi:hypothetical protein